MNFPIIMAGIPMSNNLRGDEFSHLHGLVHTLQIVTILCCSFLQIIDGAQVACLFKRRARPIEWWKLSYARDLSLCFSAQRLAVSLHEKILCNQLVSGSYYCCWVHLVLDFAASLPIPVCEDLEQFAEMIISVAVAQPLLHHNWHCFQWGQCFAISLCDDTSKHSNILDTANKASFSFSTCTS